MIVKELAPQFKIGNNLVPKDFISFTADTFSNMAKMEYNPGVDVYFNLRAINDTPVIITGNDDCLGNASKGFCIRIKVELGLDNPGKDHCN